MNRSFLLAALPALALAGCNDSTPTDPAAPFDPLAFFTGTSHGEGQLRVLIKPAVAVHVASSGRAAGPDAIILDQIVREGSKPARQRRWLLRRTSPTTFAGTLSDAKGPVRGQLVGNRLELQFAMKDGLKAEQILSLQPGGRELRNRMTVRKYGVAVAHLDEVITKG